MPTAAISAFGTLLQIGDGGGPEVFTTIAEVVEVGGPDLKLDTIDATSHGSTGGWEEVVGGILRSGEVSLSINYVPTAGTHNNTTGLLRDMRLRTKRNFRLVFPDAGATTWSFTALVTGFKPNAAHDDKLSADVTLKISGQPTLA